MLASRISFMNEIANLCDRVGADVDEVRRGIGTDSRIGASFLFPGIGYGGSCFPKDVKALLKIGEDAGAPLGVVAAVDRANQEQKRILLPRIAAYLGGLAGQGGRGLGSRVQAADRRHARGARAGRDPGPAARAERRCARTIQRRCRRRGASSATGVTLCARSYDAVEGADALVAGHGVERVPRAGLRPHQAR